ncbi:MAG: hypothetical protein ACP5IZ_07380 [Thermoprotei archaeon]|jgi:acid phosphatase family membrane protein YuiD
MEDTFKDFIKRVIVTAGVLEANNLIDDDVGALATLVSVLVLYDDDEMRRMIVKDALEITSLIHNEIFNKLKSKSEMV